MATKATKVKKTKTVIVIPVTGSVEAREIDGSLESMQALVGVYIQPIQLKGRTTLWVNEEGLIHGLPLNVRASNLARQPLVGDTFIENPSKEMLQNLTNVREARA